MIRVVAWNIRAGGGRRVEGIFQQLLCWQPHIIVLSEFRDTPPSKWLARSLANAGFVHQRGVADRSEVRQNGVFIASIFSLRCYQHPKAPREQARWLLARVKSSLPLMVGAMHIPNQHTGRKPDYHNSVLNLARSWPPGFGLLIGDTNSGQIGIDEQRPVFNAATNQWFSDLEEAHWHDAFRLKHNDKREYTWYSPNKGNGFRLDQAFVNGKLKAHLLDVQHVWGKVDGKPQRRESLSDHAALLVDFKSG
ncbi:MAG: hypothetical protein GXP16_10905 [Gammaproteobacteria bacterium]|nr:hypothetical protein [Gammaproteobacteria bacterium]